MDRETTIYQHSAEILRKSFYLNLHKCQGCDTWHYLNVKGQGTDFNDI